MVEVPIGGAAWDNCAGRSTILIGRVLNEGLPLACHPDIWPPAGASSSTWEPASLPRVGKGASRTDSSVEGADSCTLVPADEALGSQ